MTLRSGCNSGSSEKAEQMKYICIRMLPVVKKLYLKKLNAVLCAVLNKSLLSTDRFSNVR